MPRIEDIGKMRKMTIDELGLRIAEVKKEMFNLRVRLVTRDLGAHTELSKRKTELARLNTIRNEKRRQAEAAGAPTA